MRRIYVYAFDHDGSGEKTLASWSEWSLSPGAVPLSIDVLNLPGQGPTLGITVKRDDGVTLETVALTGGSV